MKTLLVIVYCFYSLLFICQTDSIGHDRLSLNESGFSEQTNEDGSAEDQQDVSTLLQSSRDVFNQFAGFQFGAARYRSRGLTARYTSVVINGAAMNDLETGAAVWSTWGGLGDVIRFPEVRSALSSSRDFYSSLGGFVHFETDAGLFKKAQRFTVSAGNRTYQQRLLYSVHSGPRPGGWAFSLAAALRYGNQVYLPGTFYQSASLYFSAARSFKKQRLSFIAFNSPVRQARSAAATAEVYELTKTPYYNSNWGLQNNVVRNAAVSQVHKPVVQLLHIWSPAVSSKLQSSLTFFFGKSSMSGLTWFDAANPDPDYYRYLPSWYSLQKKETEAESLKTEWESNANGLQQIKWDDLIAMNRGNLFTPAALQGQAINTSETRARYIVERKVERGSVLRFNTVYAKRYNRNFISLGAGVEYARNRKYKEVEDLLGGTYWLDVDQFAEDLGVDDQVRQNDLDHPNKKIKTNDRFGYHYFFKSSKSLLFLQNEHSGRRIDWYAAMELAFSTLRREGLVANGKFPDNSKGKSALLMYLNPQFKTGLTYKFTGRHFVTLQASAGSRMPEARTLFISPTTRNDVSPVPTPEKFISAECAYHVLYGDLRGRLSLYHTSLYGLSWLKTYWHDQYSSTINLFMTGINHRYQGLEFGLEKIIQAAHTLQLAVGYGQWLYLNTPVLSAWQDNTGAQLFSNKPAYLKNLRIGSTPQRGAGLSYRYTARRYWSAAVSFNYLDRSFVEPNPDRRSKEALEKFNRSEQEQAMLIAGQEELPAVWYINLQAAKSYRYKKKYNFNLSLSLNNLLNRQAIVAGIESLRWDPAVIGKFPNKYTYMQGLNILLNLSLNF